MADSPDLEFLYEDTDKHEMEMSGLYFQYVTDGAPGVRSHTVNLSSRDTSISER